MRLICKRFNTRMMRRILQTTELCLFSLDARTLPYIATFLRMQRLFKENKDRLATDGIYLYDDRQHLHMEASVGHVASHNLFGASPCNQLQLKDRNFCSNLTHSLKTGSVNTFCFGSSESATDVAATMVPSSPIMDISKNEKDEHQNSNASQPTFGFSFGESVATGSSSVDQPTTFDQTTTTNSSATFSFSFGSTNENDQEKDMNQQHRTLSNDENEYSTTKAPTTSENDSGVNISSTASVFHGLSNSTMNAAANGVDSVYASNARTSRDCMKSKYEIKPKIGFGFWNESTGKSPYVPCVEETINHYAESSIEESVCSLFIGDNTTLQSLIIHTPSSEAFSITSILSCLKALKHVVIWTANANVNFTHECVKKVVLVNSKCKADLVNYLQNVEKIVRYSCSMEGTVTPFSFGIASTVTPQGEFETTESNNDSGITELLQEFDPRIAMKIIEKITKNQIAVSYSFNRSSQLFLKDILRLASDVDIEKAKQFISYVIKDLRVPCQDLNLCELSFNSLNDQCIAQYIVYLCNEYQGGRLLRIPGLHDRGSEEILLLLLSYGWNCWKQKDELIYMMCSWITKHHYILEFLLRNFYNNWDVDALYSLMVHCCRHNRIRALDTILSYCLVNKEEVLMKALTMPVKCLHSPSTWDNKFYKTS